MISRRPRAPLDRLVERLWWNDRAEPSTTCEHALPTGRVQMVIALHDEPIAWSTDRWDHRHAWTAGIVHGPQSTYFLTHPKPPGTVIGVSFRAGGAGALLGVPVNELADRHIPIGDVWGSPVRALRERLQDAASPEVAFELLEEALAARLRRPLLIHPAVAQALHACAAVTPPQRVAAIQHESGLSAKHFIALFRAAVGLTPKHYLRVQRFGNVLRELAAGRPGTLCDLAAATGYSDQSHLTREFRELAGITPTQYRPQAPASEHHHIAAESVARALAR